MWHIDCWTLKENKRATSQLLGLFPKLSHEKQRQEFKEQISLLHKYILLIWPCHNIPLIEPILDVSCFSMGQDGGGGGESDVCVCVCVLQSVTQFHREQAVVLAWEKMHLSRKDFCEGVKNWQVSLSKSPIYTTMRTHILVILFPMMYNEVWKFYFPTPSHTLRNSGFSSELIIDDCIDSDYIGLF